MDSMKKIKVDTISMHCRSNTLVRYSCAACFGINGANVWSSVEQKRIKHTDCTRDNVTFAGCMDCRQYSIGNSLT